MPHDVVKSMKVDLSIWCIKDQSQNCTKLVSLHSVKKMSHAVSHKLLVDWICEVHDHDQNHMTESDVWHMAVQNTAQFARRLRMWDWCVYHYKSPYGLYGLSDHNAHVNHGGRWGLIVAPYCGRFAGWRLAQL